MAQIQMPLPTAEKIIEWVSFHRQVLLITEHAIYQADKNTLRKVFDSESAIKVAVANQKQLFLGTEKGLLVSNAPKGAALTFQKQNLPTDKTDFVALRIDPVSEQVWVATRDNGIYVIQDTTPKKILNALFVNDLAVISQNDYWVGTDAGLVHRVAGQTLRYAEEGVGGFEIPDNIVEKLYLCSAQKLVVQMSQPFSIFHLEGEQTAAHGVNIGFIGKKGNTIFDLKTLSDGSVLAATAEGLTHLPRHILADDHEHEGFKEIFAAADRPEAQLLDWSKLGLNIDKSCLFKKIFLDNQQNLWLAAEKQVVMVKVKKLLNQRK
jgi:hypothetical protein